MPIRPALYDGFNSPRDPDFTWKPSPHVPDERQDPHAPDYFTLLESVGHDGRNERADVIKAQTLLANAGYYDLAGTDGPTGWYGKPLELSMRKFQKDRGLTVDGIMLPGGETLAALQAETSGRLKSFRAPMPEEVDEHHNRLARGEAGLFTAAAAPDRPAGVAVEDRHSGSQPSLGLTVTSAPPAPGRPDQAPANENASGETQVAAAQSLLLPVLGAGAAAVAGAIGQSSKDKPQDSSGPPRDSQSDDIAARWEAFQAMNRAYLGEGLRHAFGDRLESRGNPNTAKSNDALIRACEEVIAEKVNPKGYKVEHVAGGTEEGAGVDKLKERGINSAGEYKKGGPGSSFPDVLFRDEKGNLIPLNSVTTDAKGNPIPWEGVSWKRLIFNIGHEVAGWLGKKKDGESDEEYFEKAKKKCEEVFDAYTRERAKGKPLDWRRRGEKPPE